MNDPTAKILAKLGLQDRNPGGFGGAWRAADRNSGWSRRWTAAPWPRWPTWTGRTSSGSWPAAPRPSQAWRLVPAPKRGEVVKALGDELRRHKEALAELVTLEMGKTLREGLGEVQEMIDVCDLAVGLSRQLYGLTMPSERRQHRLQEQWHPLGVVGVITAFNFPVAVWAWNTAIALVCGDTGAVEALQPHARSPPSPAPASPSGCCARAGHDPAVCSLAIGRGSEIGDLINTDPRVALVSYTGSVPGGRHVGRLVQERFGRQHPGTGRQRRGHRQPARRPGASPCGRSTSAPSAPSGQRCTSTRRVIVHDSVYDTFVARLQAMYARTPIGDPRDGANLMGPLVDTGAVETMLPGHRDHQGPGRARSSAAASGCPFPAAATSPPAWPRWTRDLPMVREETFAPVLYLIRYRTFEEAIRIHNDVPQGLSSAIFSNDLLETELFLSAAGSDCGIANVNAGTSGAEIGGAFGGEKETGGGRESGSDAWKAYMRRQTSAINFSGRVELAQGINLEL